MPAVTWSDFYVTVATAAATVLGLLFVAVQFNLESLPADESQIWLATARSSWVVLASLFFTSLISIVPTFGPQGRVVGTAIVLVISGRRIVYAWLPVRERLRGSEPEHLKRTLWLMIGPLVLYLLLFGLTVAGARGAKTQGLIADAVIGLFGLALRNSWDLLVELRLPGVGARESTDGATTKPREPE
jgi:hypothetical protein